VTLDEALGKRGLLVWAVILLIAWVVAGVINSGEFIMGRAPTPAGVAVTLVAVCSWLLAGWFAGLRSEGGFARLATVFWVGVVVGGPLDVWAVTLLDGLRASQSVWGTDQSVWALLLGLLGSVLLLLIFACAAPLYGLYALLPQAWEPIVQCSVTGAAVFAVILGAYFAGRWIGRRSSQADGHPTSAST
jgi:hypothetical protein